MKKIYALGFTKEELIALEMSVTHYMECNKDIFSEQDLELLANVGSCISTFIVNIK